MKPQETLNEVDSTDEKKIRILVLGESTSADYFSKDDVRGPWPRILQRRLNDLGVAARVYNEAVGGISSALLVGNLPVYLERYNPHIVITMMGINDISNVNLDDSIFSKLKLSFYSLRVVKLARWTITALNSKTKCTLQEYPINWIHTGRIIEKAMELEKEHTAQELKDLLQKEAVDEKELAIVLHHVSINLRGDFSTQVNYKKPRELINLAFDLFPYDPRIAFWKMHNSTNEMCNEAIEKLLPCGENIPDQTLALLIDCAVKANPEALNNPTIRERGIVLAPQGGAVTPTMHHYQRLIDTLNRKNIKLIAMQYPTLSLEALKQVITQNGAKPENLKGIVFVSNEENFSEALEKTSYDVLFLDRFRGSWGHTTQKGHELIADTLLPKVQEVLKEYNIKNK